MSEVKAKDIQQKLWDILGKPEKKQFTFDPILGGQRILGGNGSYWYGKNEDEEGSTDDDDDDDDDGNGGDDDGSKSGSSGGDGDPRRDPAKGCPSNGESIVGLKGMHDCGTGRCVNVNFTMPAKPPSGWEEPCKPPINKRPVAIAGTTLYKVIVNISIAGKSSVTETYYASSQARAEQMARDFMSSYNFDPNTPIMKGDDSEYNKKIGCFPYKVHPVNESSSSSYYLYLIQTMSLCSVSRVSVSAGAVRNAFKAVSGEIYDTFSKNDTEVKWPPETCAEIVSTPSGFKPACEEHDPNLLPQLKGENSAIELCDSNGNKVLIERNGKGWKYTTASCTVTVNDSGTVTSVQKNS